MPSTIDLGLGSLTDDPLASDADRAALTRFALEKCRLLAETAPDAKVRLDAAREIARILGLGQYASAPASRDLAPLSGGQTNNFFIAGAARESRNARLESRLRAVAAVAAVVADATDARDASDSSDASIADETAALLAEVDARSV